MPRTAFALCLVVTLAACSRPRDGTEPAPAADATISSAIGFSGFGPAPFGADEEAVRQAWGRGLEEEPAVEGSACHYLYFAPEYGSPPPYPIAFMIVEGRFARLDVHDADTTAPGGGRVGMPAEEIRRRYAGRLEEMPHKYGDGRYLIVSPEDGSAARLLFETDAAGTVTEWRIGLPPQVHWVEGCA